MSESTPSVTNAKVLVRVGVAPASKDEAIRQAGQLLLSAGCIDADYIESMRQREKTANTYLGEGVAIPHGRLEDKNLVRRDGIAVIQAPGGLEWNPGQVAYLVVGIAAASDSHIAILRRLTSLMQDAGLLQSLFTASDPVTIAHALDPARPLEDGGLQVQEDLAEKMEWTLDYPAGLHARPVSVWVEAARSAGVPLRVRNDNGSADPRNAVSLLQLGARSGDALVISAGGPDDKDARAALEAFVRVIESLSQGEKDDFAKAREKAASAPKSGWVPASSMRPVQGVAASPGLAVGTVFRLDREAPDVPDKPVPLAQGGLMLEEALDKTRQQMKALQDDTARRIGAGDAAIFKGQAALLDDTELITLASRHMVAGHGAAWAWNQAVEESAEQLSRLDNPLLAARAADLRDVGRRVLLNLEPELAAGTGGLGAEGPVIIIARDLAPSDTAGLDPSKVAGIATSSGGPTSHTAILARTMGLAAVVAAGDNLFAARNGSQAVVDGDSGRVWLEPSEEDLSSAREWMAAIRARREAEAEERGRPAETMDGFVMEVAANVNRPDQVPLALEQGAEGVGLMRTEFLFLERGETPGEDEQYETYRAMLEALDGRPLIVRALDIGGDKQVAHLNLPREANPFLGVRGSRLLLRRPDLFEPQMRALYRAAREYEDNLLVMFSMITSVEEVLELRELCGKIRESLNAPEIPLGIMVEVPSAALMATVLAEHVDFFSIGTNDLTQYTLAMDRENRDLAAQADSMHPAVLRLIRLTVKGAEKHGRWVGVCGGLAGDPFGAAILAGLGVKELSMTPRDIPAVKAMLRRHTRERLGDLATRCLNQPNAGAVRAMAVELEPGKDDGTIEADDQ